jgi:hypothetical protein
MPFQRGDQLGPSVFGFDRRRIQLPKELDGPIGQPMPEQRRSSASAALRTWRPVIARRSSSWHFLSRGYQSKISCTFPHQAKARRMLWLSLI